MPDITFMLKSLYLIFFFGQIFGPLHYFSNFFEVFFHFYQKNSLKILFFYFHMFSGILYHHLSILCDYDAQIGMFVSQSS